MKNIMNKLGIKREDQIGLLSITESGFKIFILSVLITSISHLLLSHYSLSYILIGINTFSMALFSVSSGLFICGLIGYLTFK